MFDSLRKTLSGLSKKLAEKDLDESEIDDILSDMEISFLQSDVALEVVEAVCSDLKKRLVGVSVGRKETEALVRGAMAESVSALFDDAGSLDVLELIRKKNSEGAPFTVVFLGINGTGKTTTVAKFAYFLKQHNLTVVMAAADTFRAGAIEQIREHADRLQVKLVAQNYNSDPAAVAKDAVMYAKSHRVNCVLVDTAGRIQTSVNLMQQVEKITKVVRPDLKIFVGDSLAGNDAVSQAREFYEYTKFDGSILTKSDADAKGGAALSIAKVTSKPVIFLGVGQEYPDLEPFRKESFLETLFGERQDVSGEMKAKIKDALQNEPDARKDPLDGLDAKDVSAYSDAFDVPPPDNDGDARRLAGKIRAWIEAGRPGPPTGTKLNPPPPEAGEPDEPEDPFAGNPIRRYKAPPAGRQDRTLNLEPDTGTRTPEPAPKPDAEPAPEPEPQSPEAGEPDEPEDPFAGISDGDIAAYSDAFDVPPPDNDGDARRLAGKIRAWIKAGRPGPPDAEPAPEPDTGTKLKPDAEPAPKPDAEPTPEPEPQSPEAGEPDEPDDPFAGISDGDIAAYSDAFDVPPPDNDGDARRLAGKIRAWIKAGRPGPPDAEPAPEPDTGTKLKPDAEPAPKPDAEPTPEPEPQSPEAGEPDEPEDPFAGISDGDIAAYSDAFDVPPPDNDGDARRLAGKIRAWIKAGRPGPPDAEPAPEPDTGTKLKPERGTSDRA